MEKKYDEIAQIVDAIQKGNDEQFDRLYELTKRIVYFELKSAGVREADIEDILQETYIKIYNKIDTIQDVQASYKWIKQLAYRTGINYVKSSVVVHEQLNKEETSDIFESEDNLSNPLPMPEDIMQNRESQRLVREILQGLPILQYKMIVAYYYNESSIKEIAESFDVPVGTVKTNLYRARAEIKERVEELGRKQGIKLYAVSALPLFSFFMDTEAHAAQLPAFMNQDIIVKDHVVQMVSETANNIPTNSGGAQAGTASMSSTASTATTASTVGKSLGTKLLIAAVCSVVVIGGVVGISNMNKSTPSLPIEVAQENEADDVVEEVSELIAEEELKTEEELETESEEVIAETDETEAETEETEEVSDESVYMFYGQLRVCANNFDGTYEVAFSKDAVIAKDVISNAKIGDVVTTMMGDQYVLVEREELYSSYFGEGDNPKSFPGESDFAVRAVGEDFWGYTLVLDSEEGYRLKDLDSATYIADGLQGGTMTVEIADEAEIYMLKDGVEYIKISPEDFKQLNWENPSAVLGESLYDTYLPIYGSGTIQGKKLVEFKQSFRS